MNPAEFVNIAATEENFWWFQGMNRILWNFLDSTHPPDGRTLEVGCGTGNVSWQYQRRYPEAQIVSMDLSPQGLKYAKARGLRKLAQADIRDLPFAALSFGTLMALDVIAHLEPGEEQAAFDEFARVLLPNGLLLIRASAFGWLRSRHSMFVNERQRFRKRTLLPVLRRSGFAPLRCTYANSLMLPVALAKFRIWEPLTNAPVESGLHPIPPALNSLLKAVLMAEAAWIAHGGNLPIGQSLWILARKESRPD
ncbi:MAG: class I SAM-dependent methyltransferase [Bryobacterales bacterium]|nr:class I SAM-dependent methyltransferase [Bryobacterales bacterium]